MGINRRTLKQRQKEIEGNQWTSKLLFNELPYRNYANTRDQIFTMEVIERGDGVRLRPTRTTVSAILNAEVNARDEGNAASEYLPGEEMDEGNASTVTSDILTEGDAGSIY